MCLICQRIEWIKAGENPYFVKELETGYVVIGDHQYFEGYTLFLAKEHVTELHHLHPTVKLRFLEEMSLVQEAVSKAFSAQKMNVELLGNGDAHAHWHIFPRREGDMKGHGLNGRGPVWWVPWEEMVAEEYQVKGSKLEGLVETLSETLDQMIETQTSTQEKTVQEGTVGSKSQEASQKKAEVVNKGDYYSVQGKYDEIVIANKHYPLSKDYNPGENPTAKAELLKLIAAMQEAGFPISDHYSGFRSYETQTQLYQDYVNKDGKAEADRYSARPGYSEHQTGLAFDLIGTDGDLVTEEKAAQWLLDHAADYGFVVRYLKGKEKETGYMAEEWHLRYVGKEAKDIATSGLSLEEYYGFEGGDYVD